MVMPANWPPQPRARGGCPQKGPGVPPFEGGGNAAHTSGEEHTILLQYVYHFIWEKSILFFAACALYSTTHSVFSPCTYTVNDTECRPGIASIMAVMAVCR